MKKEIISLVVPCYNEEENVGLFYNEIQKTIKKMNNVTFEILYVNDGSKDNTLIEMRKLAKKDKNVRYISFSRNFGKEAAMYAGLENCKGDYATIMDVDLQDPPFLLEEMYKGIKEEGYDCVAARSVNRRGYSFIRKSLTKTFYKIISKLSKTDMVSGARDYRLMTRQMLDAVLSLREYNRYSKGLFSFVGFDTKWIDYENTERVVGTSKFNLYKLMMYAIEGIVGFSTGPLLFSAIIGILFCFLSFLVIIFIIIRTLIWGDPVSGWPSLVCIMFFLSGIQLFCTGIMGEYLAKTYLETKKRPVYIIKETELDNDFKN
jgi:Glycosyltransferases involved in cell wall biogenesis